VLHAPDDVEAPRLLGRVLVAKALERDADLDLVAVVGEAPLGLEDEIRAQVGRVTRRRDAAHTARARLIAFHQRAVELHAERVDAEDHRLAAVVEGAEQELHVVVAADAVAVGERRVDRAVPLVRAYAEVDRRRRVPDQDLRRILGRNAVDRRELREPGQEGGLPPHRLVEPTVDLDVGLQARDPHLELTLPTAVDRVRWRRAGAGQGVREQHDGEQHRRAEGRSACVAEQRMMGTGLSGDKRPRVWVR
jgi:hypothetical protein